MKKYVNVVVTDADGNKEMREKAVVVSLQRQGNENKTTISLVNVEGLDFVVAVCSLLKVVDDLDLNEAVLKIASEMDVQITLLILSKRAVFLSIALLVGCKSNPSKAEKERVRKNKEIVRKQGKW